MPKYVTKQAAHATRATFKATPSSVTRCSDNFPIFRILSPFQTQNRLLRL